MSRRSSAYSSKTHFPERHTNVVRIQNMLDLGIIVVSTYDVDMDLHATAPNPMSDHVPLSAFSFGCKSSGMVLTVFPLLSLLTARIEPFTTNDWFR